MQDIQEINHAVRFTTFGRTIKQAQTLHDCPAFNVTIRAQHTSHSIEPTSVNFDDRGSANITQSAQRLSRTRLGAVLPCQWPGPTSQGVAELVPENIYTPSAKSEAG